MKRLAFLFLIISITTACSSDDSGNNLNPNNPENSNFKFLSTIISDPTEPRDSPYDRTDTLVYKEGKLFKAFIEAGCSPGSIYQYEYADNGKISVVYSASYNPYYEESTEFEELINIFENSSLNENFDSKTKIEYNLDNKIKRINGGYDNSQGYREYKYDDKGRLYKMIIYDGGSFTKIRTVTEFDDKDQPITIQTNYDGDISEVSYEYGELKNPYYALYQEYGILNPCRIISQYFITPYVVKIEQHSSSNDFYDYISSDGEYPESLNYNYNSNYNSGNLVYEFTYR